MKKSFLAGILAVVLVAVLTAGCATNPTTTSPTATPTPSTATTAAVPQNVSQLLADATQQQNFTVVTPFTVQPSTPSGTAVYNGTVSDSNGTYVVSVKACDNAQVAQTQFTTLTDAFVSQGFPTVQQNATMWIGFNATTGRGAAVQHGSSPLMPYYCMVITGGGNGYLQSMWMTMWDHLNEYHANTYGMGPHMGAGINANLRSTMQQEMEERMGSRFAGGRM
jgi:hypothetical protein